jgi:SAM-dependent methyltransferase
MTAPDAVQPHNAKSASTWSSGGAAYEEISKTLITALDHAVRRLDPRPGEHILDLATGTGLTSRLVAASGARVTGSDIAADLLGAARSIAHAQGLAISYELGDAEKLTYADGSFDGVISTFGVMFVSRPEAAAREIARICRKGGRVALTTWLPDSLVFEFFKVMKPYMPPPPDPAPPSPFAWGTRERIRELLADDFELGFEEGVTTHHERDGEAIWQTFVTGYGPTRMLAASLDEAKRENLGRDFAGLFDRFRTPLGVSAPRQYLLTLGRRR